MTTHLYNVVANPILGGLCILGLLSSPCAQYTKAMRLTYIKPNAIILDMGARLYQFTLKRQAIRALQRMPRQQAQRIRRQLDKLAEDPNRQELDIAPLTGRPGFRLRVGDLRIIFERDDAALAIDVLRIAPRGQVYRG